MPLKYESGTTTLIAAWSLSKFHRTEADRRGVLHSGYEARR